MDAPQAWLHRVALNLAYSHYRRRRAERAALIRVGSRPVHNDDSDTTSALAVRRAVAGLPKRQRTVLVLRFYSDLSVAQTAEAMHCAPGTVKSLTNRAITALRHDVADCGTRVRQRASRWRCLLSVRSGAASRGWLGGWIAT